MEKDNLERAAKILDGFRDKNVLIVGDVMLDCYWRGSVKRISPEAPVPIFDLMAEENRLGGAANVTLNLKALKANPILVSVIGNDMAADTFKNLLHYAKIDEKYILCDSSRPTTCKTRIVAGSQQMLRIDSEITNDLDTETESRIIASIQNVIAEKHIDVVILQDYNKGVLTPRAIKKTIEAARKKNIPVAHPKKTNRNAIVKQHWE